MAAATDAAFERAIARVRELIATYTPPDFAHVPDADSALFLCAIDHKSGYERSHVVDGEGPLRGSALMWAVGIRSARTRPGFEIRAPALVDVSGAEVAEAFEIEGETVSGPERRAELWRDLATRLIEKYEGAAERLNAAARTRLGGADGLLSRLGEFEAFADPLAKKSQLYAKICERRGWLEVGDPESWEVSADSVLMRLALRSGLVAPGDLEQVRAATREAFRRLGAAAEISTPILDDLLWERGREDPDLLGTSGGDLREPPRDPASTWY